MLPSLEYAQSLVRLNTRLLCNCFEKVDSEAAAKRPIAIANNMIFLSLHVLDARYYLMGEVDGDKRRHPFSDAVEDINSVDELKNPPPIEQVLASWLESDKELRDSLQHVTEQRLREKSAFKVPTGDHTIAGLIAFLVQHESYHIGQMAILRRGLGLPAMSYA